MANRPTPTRIKLVKGNPGKRAINQKEPQPKREIPSPPANLADSAKVAWGNLTVILDRMGVLTEADTLALERLCECYADILKFRELINSDGAIYNASSESGAMLIKANPAVAMLADADRRFKAYLVEFGLTPAARTKVKVADGDEKADPLAQYF